MVFDGSFCPSDYVRAINNITDKEEKPPIFFGKSLECHLIGIWNLQITYLHEDIWLWDDDVKSAFQHIHYHI